jgi:hypothetical protein
LAADKTGGRGAATRAEKAGNLAMQRQNDRLAQTLQDTQDRLRPDKSGAAEDVHLNAS